MTLGGRGAAAAAIGMIMAAGLCGKARAEVLDIDATGEVTVLRGPAVYSDPAGAPLMISAAASQSLNEPRRPFVTWQPVQSAAARNGLSVKLLEAVAWRESHFDAHAVSPKGAVGIMQLMPATARAMGVDPRDGAANLEGGAVYLARLMQEFDGDVTLALAAYNAGPGAVKRYAGVPPFPETRAFVDSVLRRLADDVSNESAR
ncbi:MAG TPA: lytic transglycosylase domain-containing protein [Caulobacteraceae bacterium]